MVGVYHVFFNKHSYAPLVWSVSNPERTFEILCKAVVLDDVVVHTHYEPMGESHEADEWSGVPSAFMSVWGYLVLDPNGNVTISPAPEPQ